MWIPDRLSSGCVLAPNTLDILETYTTLLAKMGATLDALTGGRFILGIGACWCQEEYRQYGYNYPTPAVRIRQLEEGLEIVKRLWTEDGVTFKGKYFKVENTYCYQKPDPLPPIMIASVGERLSIRLVAKYADWWNIPIPSVDLYKHKLAVVKDHCEKIGRDPDELVKTQFHMVTMAETDEEAKKKAQKSVLKNRYINKFIIGSPETVKKKMKEHIEVGVDYFMLLFTPFPDLIVQLHSRKI